MKNLPEMANQFETQIRLLLLQAINKVYRRTVTISINKQAIHSKTIQFELKDEAFTFTHFTI